MDFISALLFYGLAVLVFIVRGVLAVGTGYLVTYGQVRVVARAIADARRPRGLPVARALQRCRADCEQGLDITPAIRRAR